MGIFHLYSAFTSGAIKNYKIKSELVLQYLCSGYQFEAINIYKIISKLVRQWDEWLWCNSPRPLNLFRPKKIKFLILQLKE